MTSEIVQPSSDEKSTVMAIAYDLMRTYAPDPTPKSDANALERAALLHRIYKVMWGSKDAGPVK